MGLLIFSAGTTIGVLLGLWLAHLPAPPAAHHECDERYARMCQRYRAELDVQEVEIQRLVRGGS